MLRPLLLTPPAVLPMPVLPLDDPKLLPDEPNELPPPPWPETIEPPNPWAWAKRSPADQRAVAPANRIIEACRNMTSVPPDNADTLRAQWTSSKNCETSRRVLPAGPRLD
jgi:hypothetical protein